MLTPRDILLGVVLPFVLCGAIIKLAHFARLGLWAGPLAIGAAFTAAFGALEGRSHLLPFPPASATPWLFYIGPLFALVGLLDASIRSSIWLRPPLVFVATLIGSGFLLRFNFANHTWDATHGVAWLGGVAAVAVIWWACFEFTAIEGGVIMPLGAMLTTGIAGLVIMLVADQTIGQALGALAAAFAAAAAVVGWFKQPSLTRGTAVVVSGLGVCALAAAYFLSDVPILDLSLVAVAPVLLATSSWLPLAKRRPWLRVTIRLIIAMVPLGIALGLAAAQFHTEAAEQSSNSYAE